jgi:hypothetical protein
VWCKYCVHIDVNGKMRTPESIPGMVGAGIKENVGGVNSTMIYLYILRTFVNATMCPHPLQQ